VTQDWMTGTLVLQPELLAVNITWCNCLQLTRGDQRTPILFIKYVQWPFKDN